MWCCVTPARGEETNEVKKEKQGKVNHGGSGLFKSLWPHIYAVSGIRIAVVGVIPRSRNDTPVSQGGRNPRSVAGTDSPKPEPAQAIAPSQPWTPRRTCSCTPRTHSNARLALQT